MEKYGRARQVIDINTVRGIRFACWINKATETYSEYIIIITAFPLQQWLYERAPFLSYTYIACLCYGSSRGKTHFTATQ